MYVFNSRIEASNKKIPDLLRSVVFCDVLRYVSVFLATFSNSGKKKVLHSFERLNCAKLISSWRHADEKVSVLM